jgi:hypothetical protein
MLSKSTVAFWEINSTVVFWEINFCCHHPTTACSDLPQFFSESMVAFWEINSTVAFWEINSTANSSEKSFKNRGSNRGSGTQGVRTQTTELQTQIEILENVLFIYVSLNACNCLQFF